MFCAVLLTAPNRMNYSSLFCFDERNSPLRNGRASKREKRDQGIARMFIVIVIIFFICNTPRMILNSVEVIVLATGRDFSEGWPAW